MPSLGYILGIGFQSYIQAVDHWIAFVLLTFIGLNMVRESRDRKAEHADPSVGFQVMVILAIATSIDALAVGVTFAFLQVDIVPADAADAAHDHHGQNGGGLCTDERLRRNEVYLVSVQRSGNACKECGSGKCNDLVTDGVHAQCLGSDLALTDGEKGTAGTGMDE